MTVLVGKKLIGLSTEEFQKKLKLHEKVHIDIGTGDGTYVYKNARRNPNSFYIGVDPVSENMLETARKLNRKPSKGGADNALLVRGSAEALPAELTGIADFITVNFPWGSLLEGCAKGTPEIVAGICQCAKPGAEITVTLTYSGLYEDSEIIRRGLPTLSVDYFNGDYTQRVREYGLNFTEIRCVSSENFRDFDSAWAKKLAFGRARDVFILSGRYEELGE